MTHAYAAADAAHDKVITEDDRYREVVSEAKQNLAWATSELDNWRHPVELRLAKTLSYIEEARKIIKDEIERSEENGA